MLGKEPPLLEAGGGGGEERVGARRGPTSYSAKILVRSLGQEDPLEESMAAPPVFLRGESHGQRAWWGIVHRVMNHHI